MEIPKACEPAPAADALGNLAAAPSAPQAPDERSAPPPPPPRPEDQPGEEPEQELVPAADPRNRTDRLEAIHDEDAGDPAAAEAGQAAPPLIPVAQAVPSRLKYVAVIGGGVVLAGVVAAGIVWGLWWRSTRPAGGVVQPVGPMATASAPATKPAPVPTQPVPPAPVATQPAPPAPMLTTHDLTRPILAAAARAPAPVICMFHVELSATAKALTQASGLDDQAVRSLLSAKVWTDVPARVADGRLPASATLFLAPASAPVGQMFGQFYGLRAGGTVDPLGGSWSLVREGSPVPHFLLRVTGKAAAAYSDALIARARQVEPAGTFQPDKPCALGMLRMAPAGLSSAHAGGEALLGTAETLDDSGLPKGSDQQRQRLKQLLKKVPTDCPVVGCVLLGPARGALAAATASAPVPAPDFATPDTVLVFSLEPCPTGKATLVLARVRPDSLQAVSPAVAPMAATAEGEDIRVEGTGAEALPVLARLIPGFREVLVQCVVLAEAPPPKPQTQPAPPTPPAAQVDVLCTNKQCPSRGAAFKMPAEEVSADALAGFVPITCPQCKQPTAVVGVKCAKCGKMYARTLDACPYCGTKR